MASPWRTLSISTVLMVISTFYMSGRTLLSYRFFIWLLGLLSVLLLLLPISYAMRGIQVEMKDTQGQTVGLYKDSHALLIGVSDYTAGWQDLESVAQELKAMEETLKRQGFNVRKHINPSARQLERAFEEFIRTYGYDKDSRLLFFFSGHGYTRLGGEKCYLVPANAPDPRHDEIGFLRKALAMDDILNWSRKIEAKHALFIFDSCFSDTVFKAKALPKQPPHISCATALPVRQYFTAGSAGEEVPARG